MLESPRTAAIVLNLVIAMSIVLVVLVGYRAGHQEPRAQLEPCALVLTRESGPECR